jgi:hypothetical protein
MKFPGRREWALNMAFMLCMIFLYLMHAFITLYAPPDKVTQAQISNLAGCIAGALFLPFILPLGALRRGRRPPRYRHRLVLTGLLFLPNIVLLILGLNSWLTSSANVVVRGVTNGIIVALVHGLFISLAAKHRNLWAGLSLGLSLFIFYLALSLQQRYQSALIAPFLFYGAGLVIVVIGVFLILYLRAPVKIIGGAEDRPALSETPL